MMLLFSPFVHSHSHICSKYARPSRQGSVCLILPALQFAGGVEVINKAYLANVSACTERHEANNALQSNM